MCSRRIKGGYILLSRKIIESEIWRKPPLYLKVWVYLLSLAQHSDYKQLSRGQLRTSIPEIMENCSWYVGYRKETPTKDQIFQILEWLRKPCESNCESNNNATMITTTKATQGMLINIDNYWFYQNPKNYESNDEGNNEIPMEAMREQRQPDNINKNAKNEKNEQINIVQAETLWSLYPEKKGKQQAIKKIPSLVKEYGYEHMERTVKRYIEDVEYQRDNGFKGLRYQNGGRFFNGTYADYLDENYKPPEKVNHIDDGKEYIS